MYLLGEQPAYVQVWISRLQSQARDMLQGLTPSGDTLVIDHNDDLAPLLAPDTLYVIEEGLVHASLNDRSLFYLQDGDLLGLRREDEDALWVYKSDGPLSLVPYDRSAALAYLGSAEPQREALIGYLTGHNQLLCDAITRIKQPEFRSANGFRHVDAGEVLITEGDDADHVFIIIDGHAEAFVEGHKVGDVAKDEIFGAMAVFTCEKRSATVVASQPSTLMMIPKEQFLGMTQSNPRIAHSLIESMARRIDALNHQVAQLHAQPPQTAPLPPQNVADQAADDSGD